MILLPPDLEPPVHSNVKTDPLGGAGTTGTADGSFTGQVYTVDKTKPVISASATTLPGGATYTAGS